MRLEFSVNSSDVAGVDETKRSKVWPARMWVGLVLVAVFWPLNWTLPGLRTAYLFFPLWLGYVLVVDALVERRTGSSLWTRSRGQFVALFGVSAPVWWLFELINLRTGNWEYLGREAFTLVEYDVLCTIAFSVVMPAVFETAELVRSFHWVERCGSGARVPSTNPVRLALLLTGLAMLAALLLWPRWFYAFTWISMVLILEPVSGWLGRPHFLARLRQGDWRQVLSLSLGALVCGFFWEMWNFYSYPKWIYHTPGAAFLHIFEMPLPGYGGYIPFALELAAIKNFVWPKGPRLQL